MLCEGISRVDLNLPESTGNLASIRSLSYFTYLFLIDYFFNIEVDVLTFYVSIPTPTLTFNFLI